VGRAGTRPRGVRRAEPPGRPRPAGRRAGAVRLRQRERHLAQRLPVQCLELRSGSFGTPTVAASADLLSQLTPELFFDAVAIQVNGPAAWDLDLATRWAFRDHHATYRTALRNGVLGYVRDGSGDVTLTSTVPRQALGTLATGDPDGARAAGLTLDGDAASLQQIFGVLQPGDPAFNIVEP
jgi:linear primary-alkylsulfatase